MLLKIGAPAEHGFNEPLGLLSDCHRRIERFLDQLIQVADAARGAVLTDDQRAAMDTALRYFRRAGPLHTQDEEESLFPLLRSKRDADADAALAALAQLETDHRTAEQAHAEVDAIGAEWLSEGRISQASADRLSALLHELRAMYGRHIALEDQRVFVAAAKLLDAGEIAQMGRGMACRRSLDPGSVPETGVRLRGPGPRLRQG